jgi:hypothetical protein
MAFKIEEIGAFLNSLYHGNSILIPEAYKEMIDQYSL